jgi:hypothetical protein
MQIGFIPNLPKNLYNVVLFSIQDANISKNGNNVSYVLKLADLVSPISVVMLTVTFVAG